MIALIVRSFTQQFSSSLFCLENYEGKFGLPTVSYNQSLTGETQLSKVRKVHKVLESLPQPTSYPHIDNYHPPNVSFQTYDVIAVIYDRNKKRRLIGYQLKQGVANLNDFKTVDEHFPERYIIEGKLSQSMSTHKGWTVADKKSIEDFLGVSASQWMPCDWDFVSQDSK